MTNFATSKIGVPKTIGLRLYSLNLLRVVPAKGN